MQPHVIIEEAVRHFRVADIGGLALQHKGTNQSPRHSPARPSRIAYRRGKEKVAETQQLGALVNLSAAARWIVAASDSEGSASIPVLDRMALQSAG